jgi:hypothetical protein
MGILIRNSENRMANETVVTVEPMARRANETMNKLEPSRE